MKDYMRKPLPRDFSRNSYSSNQNLFSSEHKIEMPHQQIGHFFNLKSDFPKIDIGRLCPHQN